VKAAYLQFAPLYLEPEANRDTVAQLLDGVKADLVVLPELFTSGYFFRSREDLATVSESIPDGSTTSFLQTQASETGGTIVAGLAEREGDRVYNSAVLVSPQGEVQVYRKVHLFYEETDLFTPGEGFQVFDVTTRDGVAYRLGIMVCFDWYFPESARTLALRGADVIAHPSNLVLPYCPDSMPVRARENHVFTVTANRHGTEKKGGEELTFIGTSEVCGPSGEILRRASRTEDAVGTVSFDPHDARNRAINDYNDALEDRRPGLYASKAVSED